MNRLSVCREFCGVHSWKNGTRCRDGIKVLWCHSELVCMVGFFFFFFFFFFFLYIGLLEMTQLTRKLPIALRLILRGSPGPTA